MTDKIIQAIGKKENADVKNWYQSKVKELTYFLLKQTSFIEETVPVEKKELEVMVK